MRLPVMVDIHGGSYNSRWSYEPNYHGHALAAEQALGVLAASPDIPTVLERLFTAQAMLCQAQVSVAELARSGNPNDAELLSWPVFTDVEA